MKISEQYVMVHLLESALTFLKNNDRRFARSGQDFCWDHVRTIVSDAAYCCPDFESRFQPLIKIACDVLVMQLQSGDGNPQPSIPEYCAAISNIGFVSKALATLSTKQQTSDEAKAQRKAVLYDEKKIALALLNFDQKQNGHATSSLEALDDKSRKHYLAKAQAVIDVL